MNSKELAAMISALVTLALGHTLSFMCYFQFSGNINGSVQWYFSQCLIYAGSFFCIETYTRYAIRIKQQDDK